MDNQCVIFHLFVVRIKLGLKTNSIIFEQVKNHKKSMFEFWTSDTRFRFPVSPIVLNFRLSRSLRYGMADVQSKLILVVPKSTRIFNKNRFALKP